MQVTIKERIFRDDQLGFGLLAPFGMMIHRAIVVRPRVDDKRSVRSVSWQPRLVQSDRFIEILGMGTLSLQRSKERVDSGLTQYIRTIFSLEELSFVAYARFNGWEILLNGTR